MLSAVGLVLGLVNYWAQYQSIAQVNTDADRRTVSWLQWGLVVFSVLALIILATYLLQHVLIAQNILWGITLCAVAFYFYLMTSQHKASYMKMLVAFVLMIEAVVFFTLYQQMPTSLTLFAVNNVSPNFLGFTIDAQSFQALNPLWIVLMSPLLAIIYNRMNAKGFSFSIPYKFALGMTMCGLSFLMLYFSRFFYVDNGTVSSWWLIFSYLLQSLGELLVSALGVAMVAELVPGSVAGFVMGMWFLTSSVAGFLGATVASYTALPEHIKPGVESLFIYTNVFACIGIVTLIIAVLMWLLSPLLSRYIAADNQESSPDMEAVTFSTTYIPTH
jgi:POT family proton-dependent oligopeptide transporter